MLFLIPHFIFSSAVLFKTIISLVKYTHTPLNVWRTKRILGSSHRNISDKSKEVEESNRMGKTSDLFKKIPRELFMPRWA